MSPLDNLNPMQNYLVHEFVEDYEDGLMPRRDLIGRVLKIAGSAAAAASILTALGVSATQAQEPRALMQDNPQSPFSVAEDDPRVTAEMISFPGADGAMISAYQAKPAGNSATPATGTPTAMAALPVILVCHENRGLNPHIHDIARRYAVNGYLACAIDLLSREGGTASIADPSEIPALLTEGDPNRHVADFQAAVSYYAEVPGADIGRLGMNGFCFGGGITWLAASQIAELKAAVPYYGPPPPLEDVPNIQAAVLGVYSDDPDDFANNGRDELEAALAEAGVTYQINVYPNSQHAFNNDTGQRYAPEAAESAWNDTLAWFSEHLSA